MSDLCRCGAPADADPHPCHGFAYQCRAPARERFVTQSPARMVALAGVQLKFEVTGYVTWACDECWARTRHPAERGACPEDEPCGECARAYAEPNPEESETV